MTRARVIVRAGMTLGIAVCAQAAVHACPICFQIEDAHVTNGIRAAVGVLMGVTILVVSPVVAFAIKIRRQERAQEGER